MRVVVAMSGGVDSATCALLMKERGYDVVGMTLRLYDCESGQSERSCCGLSGVAGARGVAEQLDIPHYVIDGQDLFEKRVLGGAWEDYSAGRTPNPCVRCNQWMKFGLLYEKAREIGAQYVATGHHARVEGQRDLESQRGEPNRLRLLRGRDTTKDQSYFLFSLTPEQLSVSLLPIGNMTKESVRNQARAAGLDVADRAESQDACIAQRGDFSEALRRRFSGSAQRGIIKDQEDKILGEHSGIHHFTIGQRKGLGVAAGKRVYVKSIDAESGDVVVGDNRSLFASGLVTNSDTNWLSPIAVTSETQIEVQIRYQHRAVPARIVRQSDGSARVHFTDPQRSVSPGQAAVFYQEDRVLGGGWIQRALS